jgi:uncharacterized protein YidB (DUF937 family)
MNAFFRMIWDVIARVLGRKLGASLTSGQGSDVLSDLFGKGNVHLPDILSKFDSAGLKDQVASWIGTGKNLPISREQVEKALGSGPLKDLAAKFGLPVDRLSSFLAADLPGHVDRLTPGGVVPGG